MEMICHTVLCPRLGGCSGLFLHDRLFLSFDKTFENLSFSFEIVPSSKIMKFSEDQFFHIFCIAYLSGNRIPFAIQDIVATNGDSKERD